MSSHSLKAIAAAAGKHDRQREANLKRLAASKRRLSIPSSFSDILSLAKFVHTAPPELAEELFAMPDFDHLIYAYFDAVDGTGPEIDKPKAVREKRAMSAMCRRFGINVIVNHFVETGDIVVEGFDYISEDDL